MNEPTEFAAPSKSHRKREQRAVQEFVRELVGASDAELGRLPLSLAILAEIRAARGMKMGARKRQIGYVSKRMADEPVEEARAALAQLRQPAARANEHFHRIESWRDALIAGDEELAERLVSELDLDRQHLRALVRGSRKEAGKSAPPRSARQLFRYLREHAGDPDNNSTSSTTPESGIEP